MKDVFEVRRSADGDDVLKQLNGQILGVKAVTAGDTLEDTDSGKLILLTAAAGTVTLPAAEAGLNFKILIKVGTTDVCDIAAASGDCFYGTVHVYDADTDGEEMAQQTETYATATGTVANFDTLALDGDATTTGCTAGDIIELYAVDSTAWHVKAILGTTGTPASIDVIKAS